MEALRLRMIVEKDGEVTVTGLPFKRGQNIEMILLPDTALVSERPYLTARQLLESELVGLWKDRADIGDSAAYARQLREEAQKRG